ncbi:MAG: uroporphyrinogen-III C-methyltransferase [Acidiferrobacteraceae bacterium]|jgi:uroporphyrin-III C-methyltransferase/precorrin-2 dehydrogenase/sirohydrochlorin ferrochelatase|nr:uroporphyrinogen-III C-methyltransferase [Acidiferrobacteraceae bacterium]MDP6397407.1 siroheme synthase CysG [Arenicellales bacterium]MDP6551721.1 siroheme synthase CysG [Arenicellales bacterium]MDP6791489.1 siroheme synthase CysG [Arenicellales bacterium]MDP6918126.1 siroheme synthase CysG [Arenicellales bacterium]|tara:strand:- start:15318 stop:16766 length:1449 start_codon:yes stop_codon:yes gene_type:complete
MDALPIFLKLRNTPALVVGGGSVAERKIDLLLRAGARITVVAPRIGAKVQALFDQHKLDWIEDSFAPDHVTEVLIVIAATNDAYVNKAVSQEARERNIPVNVVDQPDLCTFTVPSIVDRSPVIVAIGTGGASPVLARMLKARLETLIPAAYGRLASIAREFRDQVKAALGSVASRRGFWEAVFQGRVAELVFAGKEHQAREELGRMIQATGDAQFERGEVYLVGAGPGDPDLLTFRALRLMQRADVVLYDRLVAPAIVDLVRRDAERIFVGKEKSHHVVPQPEINELLLTLAQQGKRVLRLKGGDPFIFGRGGEEIEDLVRHNIPFQVIPGITAAVGCACYAGIPLTHRDHAQSCLFVTGHLKDGSVDLNWEALCQPGQTVVVYMGLTGLEAICREMIRHGLPGATPAALIQQGTTLNQRVIAATLDSLPDAVAAAQVKAPTLLIVGSVVTLHDELAWFSPEGAPPQGLALNEPGRGSNDGL